MLCSIKKEKTAERITKNLKAASRQVDPGPSTPPEQNVDGLICWWCVHALPQSPCIHLPMRYDDKLNRFTTMGNFCSWQCAKAYAHDMNSAKSGEIQSFIAMMRMRAFGKYVPLWPAPKRQFLACFGGTMSIEEFRSYGGLVEPPQLYFPFEKQVHPVFTDTRNELGARVPTISTDCQNTTRLRAIENSTGAQDTLKLKRSKPLARTASKLESSLGIIRKSK